MALLELAIGGRNYTARETLSVAGTAVGFTAATFDDSTHALVTVETAEIRYTVDGTAATASVGHLAQPGDVIVLDSMSELSKFSAIRTGGVSASLQCSFGR